MNLEDFKKRFDELMESMTDEELSKDLREHGIEVYSDSEVLELFDKCKSLEEGYALQKDFNICIGEKLLFEFGNGNETTVTNLGRVISNVTYYDQ